MFISCDLYAEKKALFNDLTCSCNLQASEQSIMGLCSDNEVALTKYLANCEGDGTTNVLLHYQKLNSAQYQISYTTKAIV